MAVHPRLTMNRILNGASRKLTPHTIPLALPSLELSLLLSAGWIIPYGTVMSLSRMDLLLHGQPERTSELRNPETKNKTGGRKSKYDLVNAD